MPLIPNKVAPLYSSGSIRFLKTFRSFSKNFDDNLLINDFVKTFFKFLVIKLDNP